MKFGKLLLVVLAVLFLVPFTVFADEEAADQTQETSEEAQTEEKAEEKTKVNVYIFRGEGCSHCAEALEWFDSIQEEYGEYYNLVKYETWYDEDNAKLMQEVAEKRGEKAEGVPYIIIGDKSWNGFDSSYKDEILSQITSLFETPASERYDIMKLLGKDVPNEKSNANTTTKKKDSNSKDWGNLILILVIAAGFGYLIYYARKNSY